jgi:hypothetical protein
VRTQPETVAPGLSVRPRDAWGSDLPPRATSVAEDVRFLLVHHTASTNAYTSARDVIRSTYAFQTSPAKGWADVCYQFFIGRDGDVWEGRLGALDGPVVADATGGNQGFAQLVCLIGNFTTTAPTDAALDSLVEVLAWLAERDGVATHPRATATFVSRGSQRYRAGLVVTTDTISTHRDMSYTTCPGDALVALMPEVRERVRAQQVAWAAQTATRQAVRLGSAEP